MRRTDRLITDKTETDAIIRKSTVCRIATALDNTPYLTPLCFGYDGNFLYCHTAKEGKKIGYFRKNNAVCFEFEGDLQIIRNQTDPCRWSLSYESVIGYGTIHELTDPEDKKYGLNQIMKQYSGHDWDFENTGLANIRVWKIKIDSMTGKRSAPVPDSDNRR